jgi:hypothetical protein
MCFHYLDLDVVSTKLWTFDLDIPKPNPKPRLKLSNFGCNLYIEGTSTSKPSFVLYSVYQQNLLGIYMIFQHIVFI